MTKFSTLLRWSILLFASVLTPTQNLHAQSYSLEILSGQSKHKASSEIQKFMIKVESDKYNECIKGLDPQTGKDGSYFSAIKIKLTDRSNNNYLVFPSKYCSSFFGAHAIAYWIINQENRSKFTLLYSGQSDGIILLKSKTDEYKNIRSQYGSTSILLKFNSDKKIYSRID